MEYSDITNTLRTNEQALRMALVIVISIQSALIVSTIFFLSKVNYDASNTGILVGVGMVVTTYVVAGLLYKRRFL